MKKLIACLICCAVCFLIVSCGSTKVADSHGKTETTVQNPEEKNGTEENLVVEIIPEPIKPPRFDDWEYKGFGKSLPEWVDAAVDMNYSSLNTYFPDKNLMIVKGIGSNTDMCESASYIDSPYPEEAEFITALWVRVNSEYEKLEQPYISIRLFNKIENQKELE